MNLQRRHPAKGFSGRRKCRQGYALIMALIFVALSLMLFGAAMNWSATSSKLIQRNNQYLGALTVAEGVTEMITAQIANDFQTQGAAIVNGSTTKYQPVQLPSSEQDRLANYAITDTNGTANQISVALTSGWQYGLVDTKYGGLYGNRASYRVTAWVRDLSSGNNVPIKLQQNLQVASIPLFQFAIFYALDLEINPPANMTIAGRVHSNGAIYAQPRYVLTFQDHVTAAKEILFTEHPDDPVDRKFGSVVYQREHDGGVNTLNLPLDASGGPVDLHALVEIPPPGESPSSLLGQQRYYNKADLVVLIGTTNVTATSGAYNGFSTPITFLQTKNIINTNASFFNKRENKTVVATDFDVSKLIANYATLTTALGRSAKTVFVADLRVHDVVNQSGLRMINGTTLPSAGLTVATPDPLYVKGHYNAPTSAYRGTTNTTTTAPASLVADAVTVLSGGWADANSGLDLSQRRASATTVNVAIIAGIVPTADGYYSGGVESFHRLLENWTSRTLTYNGSMVSLFASRIATAPWGATADVYNPPTRKWSRDPNFLNASKLPPGTPELRTVIRGKGTTT